MSYERRIYQHIIPALGNVYLDKLTTGDIQQFYTHPVSYTHLDVYKRQSPFRVKIECGTHQPALDIFLVRMTGAFLIFGGFAY